MKNEISAEYTFVHVTCIYMYNYIHIANGLQNLKFKLTSDIALEQIIMDIKFTNLSLCVYNVAIPQQYII